MRSGKMAKYRKENLACLLKEIKSPRIAYRVNNYYQVSFCFHDENEAEIFRKLLLFNMGFLESRVKLNKSTMFKLDKSVYIVDVTWHEDEREELIENIEWYLQEDNMGPTNIYRENTKFYAIVTDKDGKRSAYEIAHPSLETSMEWAVGEKNRINHTLRFEQEDLRAPSSCFEAWWAKSYADELEKLRAENEQLRKDIKNVSEERDKYEGENVGLSRRLVRYESQLRSACEFLNGYGDVHIDIPLEIKNLDYFSSIVNYTTNGEVKRREFAKKVAEQVKRRASYYGVWREPGNAETMVKDNKILDDAVESAMNSFYISSDYVMADRIYVQNPAFDASTLCKSIKMSLNSWYGLKSAAYSNANKTKPPITPIFDAYDSIKDVKFANPATIVFWEDGTKTVVKAQGDEEYIPEVGLAMCICKKVMGNTRDYYRVFKHWMKKV